MTFKKTTTRSHLAPLLLVGAMTLAACESTEDRTARETQFNGQPLKAVIAQIGAPTSRNAEKAVWQYKETTTKFVPVYSYNQFGQARVTGHRRQTITLDCTYTATLKAGRVLSSDYQGNSCNRFAPSPDA